MLPPDFDGVFRFTNFTDEDFTARWDNVEYTFPAQKTTALIIPTASPEQTQSIRKKFAKELAEREFYKSAKHTELNSQNVVGANSSFKTAVTYAPSDLEPFVQRCLEPLPIAPMRSKVLAKKEANLSTDDEGNPVTKIVNSKESLIANGTVVG